MDSPFSAKELGIGDASPPQNVKLEPRLEIILTHLNFLFEKDEEGAIAWSINKPDGAWKHFIGYIDEREKVAQQMLDWNFKGYNTYVRPAWFPVDFIPSGANGSVIDSDFVRTRAVWCENDKGTNARSAIKRYEDHRANAVVVTGKKLADGSERLGAHHYFELESPIYDPELVRRLNVALAKSIGDDDSVVNPTRLLRVAGTVNYPNQKKRAAGRIDELTTIHVYPDRPLHRPEHLLKAFEKAESAPVRPETPFDDVVAPASTVKPLQALQNTDNWHNGVRDFIGQKVAQGLSDDEILAMAPNMTQKGYTVAETLDYIQKHKFIEGARRKDWAPEIQPETAGRPSAKTTENPLNDYVTPPFQDRLNDNYLVKSLLPAGELAVLFGQPNSGKSFLAMDLAVHVAAGRSWRERRVRRAIVLYCALEGGLTIGRRFNAVWERIGRPEVSLYVRLGTLDLRNNTNDLNEIFAAIEELKRLHPGQPVLVVIDTLSQAIPGGDENSSQDMTTLIRNIQKTRDLTGAGFMLVHHAGKDNTKGARGHSSLSGAAATEIEVASDGDERAAYVRKQRDYRGGEKFEFSLDVVVVGKDEDGDDVTTCVVNHGPEPRPDNGIAQSTIDKIFNEIDSRDKAGRPFAPSANSFHALQKFLVHECGIPRKKAKGLIDSWFATDCLVDFEFDPRGQRRGVRLGPNASQVGREIIG